jgi:hypothetical protein
MRPNYKRPFRDFIKKAHKPLQLAIEDEVVGLCGDPYKGEQKVGDLLGFYVWKFKFNRQQYLIAYRPPGKGQVVGDLEIEFLVVDFYKVGPHENFYDELKRYAKEERS